MDWLRLTISLLTAGLFFPLLTAASGPQEVVSEVNNRVLAIYRQSAEIIPEVQQLIISEIGRITDFATMGERATAGFCRQDAEECRRFQQVFIELLQASAMKKLGQYRADRFEYLGQTADADKATVNAKAYYGEDFILLDYLLENESGSWKVVNYRVDGIDTIANYRSQFQRILSKSKLPVLIDRLEKKRKTITQ